jgi:hypothetical protein
MANDFKISDRRFSFGAEDKSKFDAAFKQRIEQRDPDIEEGNTDPKVMHGNKQYSDHLSELGWHLESLWTEAKGYRVHIEQRWLNDLRQYRGEYEPYVK